MITAYSVIVTGVLGVLVLLYATVMCMLRGEWGDAALCFVAFVMAVKLYLAGRVLLHAQQELRRIAKTREALFQAWREARPIPEGKVVAGVVDTAYENNSHGTFPHGVTFTEKEPK